MYIPTGVNGLGRRLEKLGYKNYQTYLKSEHWQLFRKDFFRRSKIIKKMRESSETIFCESCGIKNVILSLHHKTYKNLGNENFNSVILICQDCHSKCHLVERNSKRGLHKATYKAIKIINKF